MRILAIVIALFLVCSTATAKELAGQVVKVADGDTVTVLADGQKHRIRLAGIDAPELKQHHGKASGAFLRAPTLNRIVRVTYSKRDRYKRSVGVVWAAMPDCHGDCPLNLDTGLAQVRLGHAWHYKKYQKEQTPADRVRYADAEIEARENREGLWRDAEPMPPWEWRKAKRKK
jgi:endonuclease YncB( thermonuclease family)